MTVFYVVYFNVDKFSILNFLTQIRMVDYWYIYFVIISNRDSAASNFPGFCLIRLAIKIFSTKLASKNGPTKKIIEKELCCMPLSEVLGIKRRVMLSFQGFLRSVWNFVPEPVKMCLKVLGTWWYQPFCLLS